MTASIHDSDELDKSSRRSRRFARKLKRGMRCEKLFCTKESRCGTAVVNVYFFHLARGLIGQDSKRM